MSGPDTSAWAIAIHGGSGSIARSMSASTRAETLAALERALSVGRDLLHAGASSLDAVERVVRVLEDAPVFNAGHGSVFNSDGRHELDAAIMRGSDLSCGAVAGISTVRYPVSLARCVMERSRHVLLSGAGAEAFADTTDVERVDNSYFDVPRRYEQWRRRVEEEARGDAVNTDAEKGAVADAKRGTVGAVALDKHGDLAAATSTGGLTNKRFGRIGDSPVIGAGTYANNRTCAVSGTGIGEEFIRHNVAYDLSALMEYRGLDVEAAATEIVQNKLQPGDGGVIAVDARGRLALVYNTEGMHRGQADASGRFQVAIWE